MWVTKGAAGSSWEFPVGAFPWEPTNLQERRIYFWEFLHLQTILDQAPSRPFHGLFPPFHGIFPAFFPICCFPLGFSSPFSVQFLGAGRPPRHQEKSRNSRWESRNCESVPGMEQSRRIPRIFPAFPWKRGAEGKTSPKICSWMNLALKKWEKSFFSPAFPSTPTFPGHSFWGKISNSNCFP